MQNMKTTAGGSIAGLGTAGLALEAFASGNYWLGAAYSAVALGSFMVGIFAKDK